MNRLKKISLFCAVGGTFVGKYIWLDQPNNVWAATRDSAEQQETQRIARIIPSIAHFLLVDDGPNFNNVPTAQIIDEDTFLDFSVLNSNLIRVMGDGIVSSALSVNSGIITITINTGLITQGVIGSNSFTISGTEQQINDALATLSYTPDLDFNGIDTLTIITTNAGGDTDTDTVQISITPTDDGSPNAVDDNFSTTLNTALTDNVISNDTIVDEADVDPITNAPTVQGGTITIDANGAFTYTPSNGFVGRDSFVYTLRDTDDDTDTATINIVAGVPEIVIPDNNGVGVVGNESVIENTTLTNGTFTILASAGLANGANTALSVNAGLQLTLSQLNNLSTVNQTLVGVHGALILTGFNSSTGIISYFFDPTDLAQNHSGGDFSLVDSFTITATDANDDSSMPEALDILIVDTNPVANNDTPSISEGSSGVPGNAVVGVAVGDNADIIIDPNPNPVVGLGFGGTDGIVGANLQGGLGSMVISSAGVYTYTLDNTSPAVQGLGAGESDTDVFTYTIVDGDGDMDTATISTINGVEDAPPTITVADTDAGTSPANNSVLEASGSTVNGSITVTATAGVDQLTLDGLDIFNASTTNVTLNGSEGTLVISSFNANTGVINYSYTEDGNAESHNAANDNINDSFTIQVVDNEGDSATDTLDIQILDTTPTANNDANSINENTASVSGNVVGGIGASSGDMADTLIDANTTPVSGIDFNSANGTPGTPLASDFGSLLIETSGAYTYTLDNDNPTVNGLDDGVSVTDTFTYTITDADSDIATAQLSITINGTNDAPTLSTDSNVFIESLIPDFGTGTETAAHLGIGGNGIDVFVIGAGDHVIFGDNSGGGGGGGEDIGGNGSAGGGGSDTLVTNSGMDLIFADGSGGGGGGAFSNFIAGGVGGLGGSGNDVIDAGDAVDIVFGDGFHGQDGVGGASAFEAVGGFGGFGGFGGGGGGGGGGDGTFGLTGAGGAGGFGGGGGGAFIDNGGAGGFGAGNGGLTGESADIFGGGGGTPLPGSGGSGGGNGGEGDDGAGGGGGSVGIGSLGGDSTNGIGADGATGSTASLANFASLLDGAHASVLNDITSTNSAIFTDETGTGDDVIDGGGGSDHLFGMGGNNRFVFEVDDAGAADVDIIYDWDRGTDNVIELRDNGALLDLSAIDAIVAAAGTSGDYVFANGSGQQVTIQVRDLAGNPVVLNATDFATVSLNETGSSLSTTGRVFVANPELSQTVNLAVTSVTETGTPSDLDNSTLLSFLSVPMGDVVSLCDATSF